MFYVEKEELGRMYQGEQGAMGRMFCVKKEELGRVYQGEQGAMTRMKWGKN